jgi:hypothetical protein
MDDGVPAHELLDLKIVRPRGVRSIVRWAAVVVTNLVTQGSGAHHPGGSTAVVTDRRTGRTVCERTEEMDADGTSEFAQLLDDYEIATATAFLDRWAVAPPAH